MSLLATHTKYYIYVLFGLSGLTGLIYESVWSHYLKLFLGHAAYAQALVLVIFMGGMALGAWLASKYTHNIRNLLLAYAAIELIIGICGLLFHPAYQLIYNYSFEYVIPMLHNPLYVHVYKFLAASLVILPQSILLGATFPLMSGGIIRRFRDTPGRSISILYFSNSLGAAIGLLVCAFYMIRSLGLPGTIFTAGIINICIAILVYLLATKPENTRLHQDRPLSTTLNRPALILFASFFTGMASFIYEIAWIRMLSMVLGASTHSFELMLSAFITGLAIGGYWIRKRIDNLNHILPWAAALLIAKGVLALSTVYLYGYSFELMSFFMTALDKTEQGYTLFSLASHSIALLIMLPATICAGMTLPLFTFALLKQNYGEKSIGQIYSSNTVGAIVGVVFAVFIGMPFLTLKGTVVSGVIIDMVVGLVLLASCRIFVKPARLYYASALLLLPVVLTAFLFEFNTRQMASGVFRHGISMLDNLSEVLFHQDGKTASITVSRWNKSEVLIMTNGKPDAAITMDDALPPSTDESTMTLLSALPLSIHPHARTIANIGMGSGLTAHTALALPDIESVDSIEIEEAMVRGAKHFLPKTARVFEDPRSHIHIDDARTFFSTRQKKYDLIISEPSNPWVSGVSSLFSKEFYSSVSKYLDSNGLLVQWIHTYEFNTDLLVSVLKAISETFPYYSVYFADETNLILLASVDRIVPAPDESIFDTAEMRAQLANIHVLNIEDLRFRFLGDQYLYNSLLRDSDIPANSDFNQYLDLRAEKARFLEQNVDELLNIRMSLLPVLDLLYETHERRLYNLTPTKYYPAQPSSEALEIYQFISATNQSNVASRSLSVNSVLSITNLDYLLATAQTCNRAYDPVAWTNAVFRILAKTVLYLTTTQLNELLDAVTPECGEYFLQENHPDWLGLFRSHIDKNHVGIIEHSLNLLKSNTEITLEQGKFLYSGILTGLIRFGEYEQAELLWVDYIQDLYQGENIPFEMRLLLALIRQQGG